MTSSARHSITSFTGLPSVKRISLCLTMLSATLAIRIFRPFSIRKCSPQMPVSTALLPLRQPFSTRQRNTIAPSSFESVETLWDKGVPPFKVKRKELQVVVTLQGTDDSALQPSLLPGIEPRQAKVTPTNAPTKSAAFINGAPLVFDGSMVIVAIWQANTFKAFTPCRTSVSHTRRHYRRQLHSISQSGRSNIWRRCGHDLERWGWRISERGDLTPKQLLLWGSLKRRPQRVVLRQENVGCPHQQPTATQPWRHVQALVPVAPTFAPRRNWLPPFDLSACLLHVHPRFHPSTHNFEMGTLPSISTHHRFS